MEQFNNLRCIDPITEFEYMLNFFHSKSTKKEFIAVFQKNDEGISKLDRCLSSEYLFNQVYKNFQSNDVKDLYFTLNSLYKPKRLLSNLRYMNAIYVDIDYYNKELSQPEVISEVNKNIKNGNIPKPSMVIDSGRGIYLLWKIKPIPSMAESLWRRITEVFCRQLEYLGSDKACVDPVRVLRIPGSINSKCNKRVQIISCNYITYDIKDFKNTYLPKIDYSKSNYSSIKPKKKIRNKNVSYLFNAHTLNIARANDIERLCELRNYEIKNRELTLFVYRNCLEKIYGKDIAIRKMLDLHAKFKNRMGSDKRIICDTNSVSRKITENEGYSLKNATIIEWLKITPEEQYYLSCLIEKEEKFHRNNELKKQRRRNKNGLLKSEQKKLDTALMIIDLISKIPGIKQKDIAYKLNMSKSAVSKLIKDIENNHIKGLDLSKYEDDTNSIDNAKVVDKSVVIRLEEKVSKNDFLYCRRLGAISKKRKPPN